MSICALSCLCLPILFGWGRQKAADRCAGVRVRVHPINQSVTLEMNLRGDNPRPAFLVWSSSRSLDDFEIVPVHKRTGDKTAGRIFHINLRSRIAIVFSQDLIKTVGVLAAVRVVASAGDLAA